MKFSTKDKVFYQINSTVWVYCTIIGYTIFEEKVTYRLIDDTKQGCFDAEEDQLASLEEINTEYKINKPLGLLA